ncbi:MAG TPA: type I 3-dehydroquinate dehydratase [Thermoanaerobaculia bacterium]|nr:type I 3-dehydroquinate dehydratase [Thermoanaerobaculia bacterium]
MAEATLVATLTAPPDEAGASLAALAGRAAVLEVRADLVGDLDPDWLRAHFPGRLLYTLRSRAEGGAFEASRERRRRRLTEAAARYDLIDLEMESDLVAPLLEAVPESRRLLSWHGAAGGIDGLRRRFATMTATPAALYKLVVEPATASDTLAPLLLLGEQRRADLVAFAMGAMGGWTRLLAPRLGAPWLFAAAGEVPGAPGQPAFAKLVRDYDLPRLHPVSWLAGLLGNPVAHSLSPCLHNGGYRALGIPGLYLPFHVEQFGEFWLDVVEGGQLEALGFPWRGFSVTTPHKDVALAVAGAASPLANLAEAANTLLFEQGIWEADSTDLTGVVEALAARARPPRGLTVAVLGAGGAGRTVAAGLARAGARVVIANRSDQRGREAAAQLGCEFVPLRDFDPGRFDVLVNATPLGHVPEDELVVELGGARDGTVVVDLVYGAAPTRWLEAARQQGLEVVDGREVLLHQARPQFRMMTGQDLPLPLGRELLGLEGAA